MTRRKKDTYVRKHGDPVRFDLGVPSDTKPWRTTLFGRLTYDDFVAMPASERDAMFVRCKRADELNVIEIHATYADCVTERSYLATITNPQDMRDRVREITSRGSVAIVDLVKREVRELLRGRRLAAGVKGNVGANVPFSDHTDDGGPTL